MERAGRTKISAMTAPDSITARHRENGDEYITVSAADPNVEPNATGVEEKPPVLLSTSQLVLRRGLTTLAALLILAGGITVHLIVPLPQMFYGAAANFTLNSNFTTPSSFIHSTSASL